MSENISAPAAVAMEEPSEEAQGRVLSSRIPSLDGLRAVSICMVLQCHIGADVYYGESKLGLTLYSFGITGVKIFYVISGYLITLLLLQETRRTGCVNLVHFYIRRAFRIMPAAYFYMLVAFIVFRHSITLGNALRAVFFLENYSLHPARQLSHLWSLGVEEQFYLLWPLVFVFLPRRRMATLIGVLCAVPIINFFIIRYDWPLWSSAFYSVADTIACGCLMALLRDRPWMRRITGSGWMWLVPVFIVLDSPLAMGGNGRILGPWLRLPLSPLLNLAIALCVEAAVRAAPAFLNLRWVVYLGVLSYSLYLWQQPFASEPLHLPWKGFVLPVRLFAIFSCALISYYGLERPFLRLRRQLFAQAGS